MIELAQNLSLIQMEKGISARPDIIAEILEGNMKKFNSCLTVPKKTEKFSDQLFDKAIKEFKALNLKDNSI